jgi:hypothetical protein
MLKRSYLAGACLVLAATTARCSTPPGPITMHENIVTIENQTSRDWRNVVVTLNDHFRGGAQELVAGARLNAPLSQFQTGFGQKFATARQVVFKIEVTATDSKGEPVRLLWGQSRK